MPRHVHPTPFIIRPPDDFVQQHPDLRRMGSMLSLKYAGRQVVGEADLQAVGRALWETLDLQAEFDTAHGQAGADILSIIVESGSAETQALPWETLHHPTLGFLGRHPAFTLIRRAAPPRDTTAQPEKGPLRVLLFTSLPENAFLESNLLKAENVRPETGRLNVEEEQAQVQEALLPWIAQGRVRLEIPNDGRFATLQERLKSFQPHVLFLSGHGRFHHEPHSGETPYGEFFFESETGDSEGVREEAIAAALVGMGVQAVVLSACESSKAASAALAGGLAQRISAQGIPHVIGMRESILDPAGIAFARALCDDLARAERVDCALQRARQAIQAPQSGIARSEAGQAALREVSLGQWCLPMLIAPDPARPLIDWEFQPKAVDERLYASSLQTVGLPARFIGRRAELRRYQSALASGRVRKLLITGPGGQGKTALAGKLALDLQKTGYKVFAWSARPENPWRDFEFELELALDEDRAGKYSRLLPRLEDDARRARFMLGLLDEQYQQRVVLFLDNLESLQDPDTLALRDARVAAWLGAALAAPGLVLLATSRWQLPGWQGEHLPLAHAGYGDFLQIAQQLALRGQFHPAFLQERARLRQVYDVLGGNSRGLEWFAAATQGMGSREESAFLDLLAKTESELQENMAIEAIIAHLPENAMTLLRRMPAYLEPVPREGILKLGLDLPGVEAAFDRLLAVSLVEAQHEPRWQATQYRCAPVAADWLRARQLVDENLAWAGLAADYQVYLFENERATLSQAVNTHHALRRAERHADADRLVLDQIVGPLTMSGFYATLLLEWLPRICGSRDDRTRGEALGQMGKLLIHTGDYETALAYLKQSLAICQQIGDKAGEGTTLNNISQIYDAQGDYETALAYLKQSLAIRQQIGDKAGEGTTLNNISQIYDAQGDYETALAYLKQSLAIRQQIGDKAGEGTTLNNISQIYDAQGDYETALAYLKQSLAICQQIGDKAGEGTTLNNISQIYDAQGDYETALAYLKQSLAIRQQIGDKAGLCATLFNMGHIYAQNNQVQEAVGAWVTVYRLAKQMNLSQALQALANLAPRLGLPEGLEGWEMLARRFADGDDSVSNEDWPDLDQIEAFVRGIVQAVREKSPEAPNLFEAVSKMAVDPELPPHFRELGKVLRQFMGGVHNPDLSGLPDEMAAIIKKALNE